MAPNAPEWYREAREKQTEREGGPALKGVKVKVDHFDEGVGGADAESRIITERVVSRYAEEWDEDEDEDDDDEERMSCWR